MIAALDNDKYNHSHLYLLFGSIRHLGDGLNPLGEAHGRRYSN
jgi:hypothetical protein